MSLLFSLESDSHSNVELPVRKCAVVLAVSGLQHNLKLRVSSWWRISTMRYGGGYIVRNRGEHFTIGQISAIIFIVERK